MTRLGKRASTALCLAAAILAASAASARTERLRWTHAGPPSSDSFKLYWGPTSGSYPSSLSVGVPSKDSTGAYFYDLVVPDADTIYVTVTASKSGLESVRSNPISRAGISAPPPPPPPTTASAAITGFALWNALNETVVDTSFQNGEAIPDNIRACAAIEIKTNAYLQASGPGSVRRVFDGQDRGCAENASPYAYEDESAGNFACSPSLAQAGAHTLTVTPYDGDNCTGLAGTPQTISFTVSAPAPPPPSTLGAPGQPYIVP